MQAIGSAIAITLLTYGAVPLWAGVITAVASSAGVRDPHYLPVHVQVVGSAIAITLLTYGAVPLWAGVIITAVASFVLLLLERLGVRWLEALFAVFIGLMAVAFGVMYVLAGVPTARVLEGADPAVLSVRAPRQSQLGELHEACAFKTSILSPGTLICCSACSFHSAKAHTVFRSDSAKLPAQCSSKGAFTRGFQISIVATMGLSISPFSSRHAIWMLGRHKVKMMH